MCLVTSCQRSVSRGSPRWQWGQQLTESTPFSSSSSFPSFISLGRSLSHSANDTDRDEWATPKWGLGSRRYFTRSPLEVNIEASFSTCIRDITLTALRHLLDRYGNENLYFETLHYLQPVEMVATRLWMHARSMKPNLRENQVTKRQTKLILILLQYDLYMISCSWRTKENLSLYLSYV